jgi:hypothetical protein
LGNKADERERRRAEKMARFEATKQAQIDAVVGDLQPRVVVPQVDAGIRLAPHLEREKAREPIVEVDPDGSRFALRMTYCATRMDTGEWSWAEQRGWTGPEWTGQVQPAMAHLSQLTWGEIDGLNSGTGHKMHHGHDISDLIEEAQDRWIALDLEQFDTVFRFRIGGQRQRVWGYVVQAHFHTVWADREHSLFPVGE